MIKDFIIKAVAVVATSLICVTIVTADDRNYIYGREMTAEEIMYQQQFEPDHSTYIEGELKAEPVKTGKNDLSRSQFLESSFDARNSSGVTSVKNQDYNNKSYGTCWAFAAMGMSENNILKNVGVINPDLSEMHMVYFAYHRLADPLGGTKGDFNSSGDTDYRQIGGNAYLSISALASWMGPVDESVLPYEDVEEPYLTVDAEKAYGNAKAHLQNSYWLSMQNRELVKSMIKDYGGVQISFRWNAAYYNYSTASYYKNASPYSGQTHAVTIIGWDDNYSSSNFKKAPAENGAWLVKNSWGERWGDNGYFWMSYEDVSIEEATAYVYDYETADNYDYNYQYDGTADLSHYASYGSGEAWMANIFEAQSDERLRAVSFYLLNSGMEYEIQVYTGLADESNPISGTAAFGIPQQGSRQTMGYYTIPLERSVALKKGEKFAVVVKLKNQDGNALIPLETTETAGYEVTAYSEKGQSFISYNGTKWSDRGSNGNVRIKAFTDKTELPSVWNISVKETADGAVNVTWNQGESFDGYAVYKKETVSGEYQLIGMVEKQENSYTDTGICGGSEYFYTVKGYRYIDDTYYYGRESYGAYVKIALGSTSITSKKRLSGGIRIVWNQIEDASGYCIYRSTARNGKYTIVGNVRGAAKLVFTDKTAKQSKSYYYKIRPYRFCGNKVIYAPYSAVK